MQDLRNHTTTTVSADGPGFVHSYLFRTHPQPLLIVENHIVTDFSDKAQSLLGSEVRPGKPVWEYVAFANASDSRQEYLYLFESYPGNSFQCALPDSKMQIEARFLFPADYTARAYVLVLTTPQPACAGTAGEGIESQFQKPVSRIGEWEYDHKRRKFYCNEEVFRHFGYLDERDAPELNWLQFIRHVHPDDRDPLSNEIIQLLTASEPVELEFRLLLNNETEKILRLQGKTEFDAAGNLVRTYGVLLDATAIRQAERTLRHQNILLGQLIERLATGLWLTDNSPEHRVLLWNHRAAELTGISPAKALNQPENLIVPYIFRVESDKGPSTPNLWYNGKRIEVSHHILTPDNEQPGYRLTLLREQSDTVSEPPLAPSPPESKALVVDLIKESLIQLDADLRVKWMSPKAGKFWGTEPRDAMNRHCYALWFNRNSPCTGCPVSQVIHTGEPISKAMPGPLDKERHVSCYPLYDVQGRISGVLNYLDAGLPDQRAAHGSPDLIDLAPVPVVLLNENGLAVYANTGFRTLFSIAENFPVVLDDLLVLPEIKSFAEFRQTLLSSPVGNHSAMFRFRGADGQIIWLDIQARRFESSDGLYYALYFDNLTHSAILNTKQSQDIKRYRHILELMGTGVAVLQAIYDENHVLIDFRLVEVNSAFQHLIQPDSNTDDLHVLSGLSALNSVHMKRLLAAAPNRTVEIFDIEIDTRPVQLQLQPADDLQCWFLFAAPVQVRHYRQAHTIEHKILKALMARFGYACVICRPVDDAAGDGSEFVVDRTTEIADHNLPHNPQALLQMSLNNGLVPLLHEVRRSGHTRVIPLNVSNKQASVDALIVALDKGSVAILFQLEAPVSDASQKPLAADMKLHEVMPFPFFAVDKFRRLVLWNQAMATFTGYAADQMLYRPDGLKELLSQDKAALLAEGKMLGPFVPVTFSTKTRQRDAIVWRVPDEIAERNDWLYGCMVMSSNKAAPTLGSFAPVPDDSFFDDLMLAYGLSEPVIAPSGEILDFRLLQTNRYFEELVQGKVSEIRGQTLRNLIPDIDKHWIEHLATVYTTGKSQQFSSKSRFFGRTLHAFSFVCKNGLVATVFTLER